MASITTDYYIEQQEPVFIDYNNEIGDWYYAVALYECRDDEHGAFWIASFSTLQYAVDFCMKHKLPVMGTAVNYAANKKIEVMR